MARGRPRNKYLYVVSSTRFNDLKEALDQLDEWQEQDNLDCDARVYKVSKTFVPKLVLVEEK